MKKICTFLALFLFVVYILQAQTSTFYDFNTTGQLSAYFNQTGASANITQSTNSGLSGSGDINITSASTNEVFTTKSGYSLGNVDSKYTFTSFIKSVYNSGYSGLGFTASSPAAANTVTAYKPVVALGISVHGGGFIFQVHKRFSVHYMLSAT